MWTSGGCLAEAVGDGEFGRWRRRAASTGHVGSQFLVSELGVFSKGRVSFAEFYGKVMGSDLYFTCC